MATTVQVSPQGNKPIPFDQYIIPGTRVFPEGVVYDPATDQLFTASYGKGSLYRTALHQQEFEEISPAGANGCTSLLGVRMDHERGRLFASAGVTGMAFVFDAQTGQCLGKFTNGLAPKELGTAGPGATSPTLINDVAVIKGDAYFTDSYHPTLFKLSKEAVDAGGEGKLESWLDFNGTVLQYTKGDGLASGLNLNGIIATPDDKHLIVVQTNSGKLFRITLSSKEVVEVKGSGQKGGDGMYIWNDPAGTAKMLVIDMTQPKPLTKLRLNAAYTQYEIVGQYTLAGNVSPTNAEIIGDRILITESQLVDVMFGKTPEHLPYRIINYPLSVIGE